MIFRSEGAAGKAGHACECGKAYLLHRGVGEPALPLAILMLLQTRKGVLHLTLFVFLQMGGQPSNLDVMLRAVKIKKLPKG